MIHLHPRVSISIILNGVLGYIKFLDNLFGSKTSCFADKRVLNKFLEDRYFSESTLMTAGTSTDDPLRELLEPLFSLLSLPSSTLPS